MCSEYLLGTFKLLTTGTCRQHCLLHLPRRHTNASNTLVRVVAVAVIRCPLCIWCCIKIIIGSICLQAKKVKFLVFGKLGPHSSSRGFLLGANQPRTLTVSIHVASIYVAECQNQVDLEKVLAEACDLESGQIWPDATPRTGWIGGMIGNLLTQKGFSWETLGSAPGG